MSLPYIVDGETDLDSLTFNPWIRSINQADNLGAGMVAAGSTATELVTALSEAETRQIVTLTPDVTYRLAASLAVATDHLGIDGRGATIEVQGSATGTLKSGLTVFALNGRTGVTIRNIRFVATGLGFTGLSAAAGVIDLLDCIDCTVENCTFELAGHSGDTSHADAVVVRGTNASKNRVLFNRIVGGGIRYSYAGACHTLCSGNVVESSASNAFSGTGNGGTPTDNIIANNHILNPGRMGVEDFGTIYRTQIINNVIVGPDTPAASSSMGISAVGSQPLVSGNTILNFKDYGIETGGRGTRVANNLIRNTDSDVLGLGIGIIVNAGDGNPVGGAVISGNYVEGWQYGILANNASGPVAINGNVVTNCLKAISGDSTSAYHFLLVENNIIRFTTPNNDATNAIRSGILISSSNSTGDRGARVIGNAITWESTAASGTSSGVEYGMQINAPNVLVGFNTVDANSITGSGSSAPAGISANGSTVAGLRVIANDFLGGALAYVNNFTNPLYVWNSKAPDAGTARVSFFNVTPAAQGATNADTSGATLTQLETEVNELKALLRASGLLAA